MISTNQLQSYINHEICKACELCAKVCPNMLIEKSVEGKMFFTDDFEKLCINCGHCMAICPTKSVQIEGFSYKDDFFELPKNNFDNNYFQNLVQSRRAVRKYKDKPVSEDILEKIVKDMTFAPMGFPPSQLEIIVVSSKELLDETSKLITQFYEKVTKWLKNPFIRYMIKRKAPPEDFASLNDYIIPIFTSKAEKIKEENIDAIYRNAPALFLIHADKNAASCTEDGIIVMTYGFLSAHSFGLGTCPVSLIPPAVNKDENLKNKFNIPEKNKLITSFIVGYPKYKYHKGIKRNFKSIKTMDNE